MRRIKKFLSATVTASMVLGSFQPASIVFAAANDIQGHWAETVISTWQDNNLISGYEDGSFRPNQAITRAEFVRLMNQSLQLTEQGSVDFSDVTSSDWFYNDVAIAMGEGYCSGFPDGTFHPQESVTRAQAATFVSNAKGLSANAAGASSVTDELPSWAAGSVGAMLEAGYMSGYPDGSFNANGVLTRAEAVSTLDRVMGNLPPTDTTDEEEEGKEKVDGLTVDKSGQTIKDQVIDGDLLISEKVGSGTVYLEGLTINGDLIVEGGGSNSVYLKNCKVKGLTKMAKKNARLVLEGNTETGDVEFSAPGHLDSTKDFKGEVGEIKVGENLGKSDSVKINVKAERLVLSGVAHVVILSNITNVVINKGAEGAKIEVSSGAKVGNMEVNVKVTLTGDGKIETLEANVSGITKSSSLSVNKTETPSGVDKPTTNSGGGGGGGSSSTTKKVPYKAEDIAATPVQKGTKLANSQLTGTFQVSSTDTTKVEGTLAWSKGDTIVNETGLQPWIFTPKDTNTYMTVTGNIEVIAQDGPVQKTPKMVSVTATEVKKGAALDASQLSGSFVDADDETKSVPGNLAWTDSTITVDETGEFEWTFTPSDATAYRATTGKVEVKATDSGDQPDPALKTPVVAEAVTAAPVNKDAKLSDSTLSGKFVDPDDASVEVKGTLAWDNPDATVSAEGPFKWTFTPTDSATYNKVTGSVTVTLSTATSPVNPYQVSVIASAVDAGQTLADSNLDGVFNVAEGDSRKVEGTLVWNEATDVKLTTTEQHKWKFTPDDTEKYNEITGSVEVKVNDPNKKTPVVDQAVTADNLTEGQTLSDSNLAGTFKDPISGTTLTGNLVWDEPTKKVEAGTAPYGWTFTVTGTTADHFNPLYGSVTITVAPVQKEITMTGTITASKVEKDAQLITSTLDISQATFKGPNGEDVEGRIAWKSPETTVTVSREQTWVYTPANTASYKTLEGEVRVEVEDGTTPPVAKVTPVVNGTLTATAITLGQFLSDSALTGTFKVSATDNTNVDGILSWTDKTIQPTETGTYNAGWTFVPTETAKYNNVTGTVDVIVNAATGTDPAPGKVTPVVNQTVAFVFSGNLTSGQTNVTLTPGNLSGTFKVSASDSTAVAGNFRYKASNDATTISETITLDVTGNSLTKTIYWVFVPTDASMYENVSDSLEITFTRDPKKNDSTNTN